MPSVELTSELWKELYAATADENDSNAIASGEVQFFLMSRYLISGIAALLNLFALVSEVRIKLPTTEDELTAQ